MKTRGRKTSITSVEPNRILLRGYDIADVMGRISWGSAVLLTLTGEIPEARVGRMMDAILVAIIDHGPTAVSTLSACTAASAGAPLSASVAAGILGISKHHGGAIEDCMTVLQKCVGLGRDPSDAAAVIVLKYQKRGERIPGFGHRQHMSDPRARRLFELASEEGIARKYVAHVQEIEAALSKAKGKRVPLNADGAIAAVLCEIDFPKGAANGIFMMARVPGLIAHCLEEQSRNPPLLPINPENYEYDGPQARDLPVVGTPGKQKR